MIDFRGARGSNTGDDFHELRATRQAIRLLSNEDGLEAIAVEGVSARDEAGGSRDAWDGVDCTQYFGGRDAAEVELVRIEQLEYSAANPEKPWTVPRLVAGRRGRSVIGRLARAWKGLETRGREASSIRAVLNFGTSDGSLVFKDYVESRTNGEVEVAIYFGGQFCGSFQECIDQIMSGVLEVTKAADGEIYVPTPEEKAQFQAATAGMKDWFVGQYGDEWLKEPEAAVGACESSIDAEYAEFAN